MRKLLEEYPDDLPVLSIYPYGDHSRSTVATELHEGRIEERGVIYSDYLDDYRVLDEDEETDEVTYRVLTIRKM